MKCTCESGAIPTDDGAMLGGTVLGAVILGAPTFDGTDLPVVRTGTLDGTNDNPTE